MTMRVAIAVRASPDWDGLAADSAAGRPIDPSRFADPRGIPSFPTDIPALIARWDTLSPVPFFACRVVLRDIAARVLGRVAGAEVMPWTGVAAWLPAAPGPARVLFCDDDDWLAPDLVARLPPAESADSIVFPMARIGFDAFTVAPAGVAPRDPIGPVHPVRLRYHTNNYALTERAFARAPVADLLEHAAASRAADRLGFTDVLSPEVVAVTSKTPCSASVLAGVVADRERFAAAIARYIAVAKRLPVPPAQDWARGPLWETIRLFERVSKGR